MMQQAEQRVLRYAAKRVREADKQMRRRKREEKQQARQREADQEEARRIISHMKKADHWIRGYERRWWERHQTNRFYKV